MKTQFHYKNHRGEVELRIIEPISLDYVCTPHPEYGYGPGWFLHGLDYTERDGKPRNGEPRSFALSNIQMLDFRIPMAAHGAAPSFRIFLDGLDAPLSKLHVIPGNLPMVTGVKDMHGVMLRLGDRVRYNIAGPHTKEEYWNPEYEIIWDAPKFGLKHVGGGKDGGSHDFILKHGGGNGSLEKIS